MTDIESAIYTAFAAGFACGMDADDRPSKAQIDEAWEAEKATLLPPAEAGTAERIAAIAAIDDGEIDFSDLPEQGEEFFRRARFVRRRPGNEGGTGGGF